MNLVLAALFIGVSAILKSFETNASQDLRFNLCDIPWILSGIVLGPVWGFAVGAISDVVNYFIRPIGAFVIGFTFAAGLVGAIPGYVFMKQRETKNSRLTYAILSFVVLATFIVAILILLFGTGLLTIVDRLLYLRGLHVSWLFIGILFFLFAASIVVVFWQINKEQPDMHVPIQKVFFSVACAELFCSFLIDSVLLYFMYGSGTLVTASWRMFKVLIVIPVYSVIVSNLVNALVRNKLVDLDLD